MTGGTNTIIFEQEGSPMHKTMLETGIKERKGLSDGEEDTRKKENDRIDRMFLGETLDEAAVRLSICLPDQSRYWTNACV
jgi:hypothetical protein